VYGEFEMSVSVHSVNILDAVSDRSNPYHVRQRRRYLGLSGEQQASIARGYQRHRLACERSGIDPDPAWIAEAIEEESSERGKL
jgi:hypothetical protein